MKRIFTAGYGNMAPDHFVAMLKAAGVTLMYDVRCSPRGWNSHYTHGKIEEWLFGHGIEVDSVQGLGCGKYAYCKDLGSYKEWIATSKKARRQVDMLVEKIKVRGDACRPSILCCEGKAFDPDGTPRCHRVYVAEALKAELGEGWEVKHL